MREYIVEIVMNCEYKDFGFLLSFIIMKMSFIVFMCVYILNYYNNNV